MLHCDLRVRWKVASDLRFRAAISEPKTPSFCGISGDLAQSTRKSLAIAIVRFAPRPRLSRVKGRSSPARGYTFGRVCSYMAGHEDAGVVTSHVGTNAPKFAPPRWGRPGFDPAQTGLCEFGCGFRSR